MKKWCIGIILSSMCLLGGATNTLAAGNTSTESVETEVTVLLKRAILPENPLPGGTIIINNHFENNQQPTNQEDNYSQSYVYTNQQNQLVNQNKVENYSIPSKAYPKTNEESGILYTLIGSALVGIAGALLIVKKRKEKEEEKDVSTSY